MHARTRQAQKRVPRPHVPRQQAVPLRRAHGESGEVVIATAIHARHLGRLAPDQGASGLTAALGDPGDDRGGLCHLQTPRGEIIEEEQRVRALHHQVVDAHRHEVDAHRVMQPGLDRDTQFGADAIRGRNQDRIVKSGGPQVEQGAKSAQPAHDTRAPRGAGERLDRLHQGIARVDVHPSGAIGQVLVRRGPLRARGSGTVRAPVFTPIFTGHGGPPYAKPGYGM